MIEIYDADEFSNWDFQVLAVNEGEEEMFINMQLFAQMMGWVE